MAFVSPNDPSMDAMQCSVCGDLVIATALAMPHMTECPSCGAPANEELVHEIVAEPIEAWRVWRVVPPGEVVWTKERELRAMADAFDRGENPFRAMLVPKLAAVGVADHVWSRTEDAKCHPGRGIASSHDAPHAACSCGVWALKLEDSLSAVLSNYGNALAFGKVQLWGRIIEHEVGYRAEHARPVSVTVVDGDQELCDALAREYECEVKSGSLPPGATSRPEGGGVIGGRNIGNSLAAQMANQAMQAAMFAAALGQPPQQVQIPKPPSVAWRPKQPVTAVGFKRALSVVGPQQFPTLARAVAHMKPALNPKIEWLDEKGKVSANYCSIVRTPMGRITDQFDALASHLLDVEQTLLHGIPEETVSGLYPRRCCGGVLHYLGRKLRPRDRVALRPLRDLVLRDCGNGTWEWLSEFSLQVSPAPKIRGPVTTIIKGLIA